MSNPTLGLLTEIWNTTVKGRGPCRVTIFVGPTLFAEFEASMIQLQRELSEAHLDANDHGLVFKSARLYCVPAFRPWQYHFSVEPSK